MLSEGGVLRGHGHVPRLNLAAHLSPGYAAEADAEMASSVSTSALLKRQVREPPRMLLRAAAGHGHAGKLVLGPQWLISAVCFSCRWSR